MSITDELRGWANGFAMTRKHYELQLLAIADRIDAEHEAQLNDAFETRNSDENLESDGWVRLPVDADGEYIHVGDVMDGTCPSGKHVNGTVNAIGDGVFWLSNVQFSLKPDYMHHHNAPTVEDVLDEFANRLYEKAAYFDEEHVQKAITEYAAKLRLAGDAE